ncbi:MAG: hypothetical protein FWE40_06690 [Oscillospiraceae bacterium]|nr:hypothetical protein [Oscillospiraceae bacterium]
MNMKKLLAILLAMLMLAVGAMAVLSSAAGEPEYSFFPDCGFCEECGDADVYFSFAFAYYPGYFGALLGGSFPYVQGLQAMFNSAEAMIAFNAAMDELDGLWDDDFLGMVRALDAVANEYMLPIAMAFSTEFFRTIFLFEIYDDAGYALPFGVFNATSEAAVQQVLLGDVEDALAIIVGLNDTLVEILADQDVEVRDWLRSPATAPACPVNPEADVCLCDEVITTAPAETTTVAETTTEVTTEATTTVVETTTEATTEATTTTTATAEATTTTTTTAATEATTATTEITQTTTPPQEGLTTIDWLAVGGVIVLVLVNLFAIFGFVRILINM